MKALAISNDAARIDRGSGERPPDWLVAGANLEPCFGGISAVIGSLCQATAESGKCRISLAAFGTGAGSIEFPGVPVHSYPLRNSEWVATARNWRSLNRQIAAADGVHIHGIWQKHCAFSAHLARRARTPYIVSAHGMLERWALGNKSLKKMAYSALVENRNLRHASCLHALTFAEAADYKRIAASTPVAIIPNGVSIPGGDPERFLAEFPELRGRRLILFLGRLHPKKGLDRLCRAWHAVQAEWPEAQLVLAGPDFENTRVRIETLADTLGIRDRLTFTGMLTGTQKWDALAAAGIFVLPSYSEGLSVSVLEALGMGLPSIVTAQCNLPEVRSAGCGWVIEGRSGELEEALGQALGASAASARKMGACGRELVAGRYSWEVVGAQMSSLYRWVLGGSRSSNLEIV